MQLILAPMQGLVDAPMRNMLTQIGGFDECVSEFVRITHTVHSKSTWLKHVPELENHTLTPAGIPCTVQILGSDAENMALNALEAIRFGAKKIDINFGCPAPTVNKHQGGAVLLKTPDKIFEIVKTIRNRLPESIPLTAKMRLGFEHKDLALECAQAIENGGACQLTVHARTKVEGYTPPAHWIWVRKIKENVAIPVIANGDVFNLQDYLDIKNTSGCDSVMLGRGAIRQPDLAKQIKAYESGHALEAWTWAELLPWIQVFVDLCCQVDANSKYPIARLKQWLGMLKLNYSEAGLFFETIRRITDIESIQLALNKELQQYI